MKSAAKFTRDNPCTKVHLFNCFFRKGAFVSRLLVEAKAEIGDNAPKYLAKQEYLLQSSDNRADYYTLTPDGEEWLRKGLLRHLELHPEDLSSLVEVPPWLTMRPITPTTRARVIAKSTAPVKTILRRTRKP